MRSISRPLKVVIVVCCDGSKSETIFAEMTSFSLRSIKIAGILDTIVLDFISNDSGIS